MLQERGFQEAVAIYQIACHYSLYSDGSLRIISIATVGVRRIGCSIIPVILPYPQERSFQEAVALYPIGFHSSLYLALSPLPQFVVWTPTLLSALALNHRAIRLLRNSLYIYLSVNIPILIQSNELVVKCIPIITETNH